MKNPLLDVDTTGARAALILISSGPSRSLRTAFRVVDGITARMRSDANVIFGVRVDRKYEGIVRVLTIMTGVRSPILESIDPAIALAADPSLAPVTESVRAPSAGARKS